MTFTAMKWTCTNNSHTQCTIIGIAYISPFLVVHLRYHINKRERFQATCLTIGNSTRRSAKSHEEVQDESRYPGSCYSDPLTTKVTKNACWLCRNPSIQMKEWQISCAEEKPPKSHIRHNHQYEVAATCGRRRVGGSAGLGCLGRG